MSAPQTNLEKQEKRHKGPLVGITLALLAAVAAVFFFTGADEINDDAAAPDGAPAAVEQTNG